MNASGRLTKIPGECARNFAWNFPGVCGKLRLGPAKSLKRKRIGPQGIIFLLSDLQRVSDEVLGKLNVLLGQRV